MILSEVNLMVKCLEVTFIFHVTCQYFFVFSTCEIQVLGELRSGIGKLENYLRMYMLQGI